MDPIELDLPPQRSIDSDTTQGLSALEILAEAVALCWSFLLELLLQVVAAPEASAGLDQIRTNKGFSRRFSSWSGFGARRFGDQTGHAHRSHARWVRRFKLRLILGFRGVQSGLVDLS